LEPLDARAVATDDHVEIVVTVLGGVGVGRDRAINDAGGRSPGRNVTDIETGEGVDKTLTKATGRSSDSRSGGSGIVWTENGSSKGLILSSEEVLVRFDATNDSLTVVQLDLEFVHVLHHDSFLSIVGGENLPIELDLLLHVLGVTSEDFLTKRRTSTRHQVGQAEVGAISADGSGRTRTSGRTKLNRAGAAMATLENEIVESTSQVTTGFGGLVRVDLTGSFGVATCHKLLDQEDHDTVFE
jgi:hypothetical protein